MKNNNTSRTENSLRNSLWGVIGKIVSLVCPFIFRAIIIRYIGAHYVGLNGLFTSILAILNMTELGVSSSVVFMMYKPIAEGNQREVRQLLKLIRKVYKIIGFVILIAGCLVFFALPYLVKNDTGESVNIYILYSMYLFHTVMSYFLFAYRTTIFTANQRSDIISKIVLISELCRYSLQAFVLFFTRNYYLYLSIYALIIIPQSYMYYRVSKKMFPDLYCDEEPTVEQFAALKGKVMPLMLHRIGGKFIISIDDIIISAFLGLTYLTKYDNYYDVLRGAVAILTVLRNGIMASIGNKLFTDSLDNTYSTYKGLVFIWIGLVGIFSACLAGVYQPFMRLWVGEKYIFNAFTMLCIVFYFFIWQFRYIGVTMKDSAGMWEPDQLKPVVGMILNVLFSILVVKMTGSVLGVLFPTMFIMLFIYFPWETYILFSILFKRSATPYLFLVLRCVCSSIAAIIITYYVGVLIGEGSIIRFLIRVVICSFVATGVYALSNINVPEGKMAFNIAKKMFKKIKR